MKTIKINDERILAESNKVYKTCFIALCIGIFIDTIFKFTVWYYYNPNPVVSKDGIFVSNGDILPFYVVWGIEALLLSAVFLLCLFSLAKKGILLGSKDLECKKFPAGRFAIISLIGASTVFILILLSHLITSLPLGSGGSEYGIWGVAIMLFIYALIAVPIFVAFYLMFYIAYRVAKTSIKKNETDVELKAQFLRFDTLKDLYDKLILIEFLKDKIQLCDEKIEIVFHKNCILYIKLKIYFSIYFNDILCCNNIEEQDIWEVVHGYFQENKIYVEFEGLLGKRKISELERGKFEHQKERLQAKKHVKIYTIKELLYQS